MRLRNLVSDEEEEDSEELMPIKTFMVKELRDVSNH